MVEHWAKKPLDAGGTELRIRGWLERVLGVRPRDPNQWADPEHLQLLESFAAEIGGALESTRMSEEIGRAEMMMETDTLHQPKNNGSFRLSVLLSPHRILIATGDVPPPEIRRLLLMRLPIQNKKAALRAVLEREKAGPTLIGSSVAIPHARMDGLAQIEAALAISPHGPVRICLLFLSPTGAPKEHLAFLAGVAAFFREEKHVAALSRLTSPDEVLSYIRQAEW
jgi:PTS system nitrogen regulatory IIA component